MFVGIVEHRIEIVAIADVHSCTDLDIVKQFVRSPNFDSDSVVDFVADFDVHCRCPMS